MSRFKTTLMVIGLDGATYRLILPLVREGRMPVFAKLLDEGAWAPLESTRPPLTCPAWPVFYTGKNPGKLGAIDFMDGSGNDRIVSYADIKGVAFWDIAAHHGMRSLVINMPITYPPRIVNGILLSGMLTPPDKSFCSSRVVMDEILENVGDYIVDLDILTLGSFDRRKSLRRFYDMMEQRHKAAMYLKKAQPHDIMVVVFQGTDIVSHRLWDQPKEIENVYRLMDRFVGELAEDVEDLLIMSDHGFAGYERGFRVNQFLLERGDLVRKKANSDSGFTYGSSEILEHRFGSQGDKALARIRDVNRWLWYLGLNRAFIRRILGGGRSFAALKKLTPAIVKKLIPPARFVVDRERSIAFLHSSRTRSICINVPRIPPHSSYESYKEKLVADLLSLRDPETGERIISRVYQRQELYHGPYVGQFPDLFLETTSPYLIRGGFASPIIDVFPTPKSAHDQHGIFLYRGPGVKPGFHRGVVRIQDLAPTILYLLGLPIPRDMDGHVHSWLRGGHEITRGEDSGETIFAGQDSNGEMTHEEEREVIGKLRALGYMD
jgi:predicted AlkP superfamily phosphohydrolase/phosphomutase